MSKHLNIEELNKIEIASIQQYEYKDEEISDKFPIGEIEDFLKNSLKPLLKGPLKAAFEKAEFLTDQLIINPIITILQKHANNASEEMKNSDILELSKKLLADQLQDLKDLKDNVKTDEDFAELLNNPKDPRFELEPLMIWLIKEADTEIEQNLLKSAIFAKDEDNDGKVGIGDFFSSVYENAVKPVLNLLVSVGYKFLSNLIDDKFDGISEDLLQASLDALNKTIYESILDDSKSESDVSGLKLDLPDSGDEDTPIAGAVSEVVVLD